MKLLYLYIKDFGCFKDIEFNFDSNWKFHLNKSNPSEYFLECQKQDVLPDHFWTSQNQEKDVVECISTIVGVNGSGKTTIIRAIQEILANSNHILEHIIIFQYTKNRYGRQKQGLKCQKHLLKHISSDMLKKHIRGTEIVDNSIVYFNETQIRILRDYLPKPFGNGKKIEELSEDDKIYKVAYDFFTLGSPNANNKNPLLEEIRQKVTIKKNFIEIDDKDWEPFSYFNNVSSTNFLPIYYSAHFTTESVIDSSRVKDLSTTHCLKTGAGTDTEYYQNRSGNLTLSPIDVHQTVEYQSVLHFLNDASINHPNLLEKLHIPDIHGVTIVPEYNLLKYATEDLIALRDNELQKKNDKSSSSEILREKNLNYQRFDRIVKLIIKKHTNEFFINAFICYFACLCRDTLHGSIMITHKQNYTPDIVDKLIEVLEYVVSNIPQDSTSSKSIPKYQKLHKYILSKIENIDSNAYVCFKTLDLLFEDNLQQWFKLFVPERLFCRVKENIWFNWILGFIDKYFKCKTITNFLSFSFFPKVSSGEMAFITFFSRFFMKIIRDKQINKDEILLFMDEFETVLHPQWQLDLVKLTISFLEAYLPQSSIHIIFASHSPMLLSDIPSGNVCFLDKKDGKTLQRKSIMNTYGANVFDLYRNSYFLYDGTIGKFASERIQRLLDIVNEKSNKSKDRLSVESIKQEALLIGDPLIRNYILERLLYQQGGSLSTLEKQKEILKERLAQIETELQKATTKGKN